VQVRWGVERLLEVLVEDSQEAEAVVVEVVGLPEDPLEVRQVVLHPEVHFLLLLLDLPVPVRQVGRVALEQGSLG
jgi:hypothetical protein